jgi:hypothetical protein
MQIDLKLNIDSTESKLLKIFETLNLEHLGSISPSQLYNLSVYMDIIKKSKGIKNPISNQNIILHAYNYDIDDNCEYWVVLDKNLKFTDIGIPFNLNVDNKKSFENVPDFESNIIKEIKKNFNSDISISVE